MSIGGPGQRGEPVRRRVVDQRAVRAREQLDLRELGPLQELGVFHEDLPTSISRPPQVRPGADHDQRDLALRRQRVPVLGQDAGRAGRAAVAELVHVEQVARRLDLRPLAHRVEHHQVRLVADEPQLRPIAGQVRDQLVSAWHDRLPDREPLHRRPFLREVAAGRDHHLVPAGRVGVHDAVPHPDRRRDARRDDGGRTAVAPEHGRAPVAVVDRPRGVLDVHDQHVVGHRLGAHRAQVWSCTAKLEQAELRSYAGAVMPSSAATWQASAGIEYCGEQPPAITRPICDGFDARALHRQARGRARRSRRWCAPTSARDSDGCSFFVRTM